MYAVIKLKWHQYIVNEGTELVVDRLQKDDDLEVKDVLLVFDENWKNVKVWYPYVNWAVVKMEKIEDKKWKKIRVLKFHRKNRYCRVYGFRPYQTVLKVSKIEVHD